MSLYIDPETPYAPNAWRQYEIFGGLSASSTGIYTLAQGGSGYIPVPIKVDHSVVLNDPYGGRSLDVPLSSLLDFPTYASGNWLSEAHLMFDDVTFYDDYGYDGVVVKGSSSAATPTDYVVSHPLVMDMSDLMPNVVSTGSKGSVRINGCYGAINGAGSPMDLDVSVFEGNFEFQFNNVGPNHVSGRIRLFHAEFARVGGDLLMTSGPVFTSDYEEQINSIIRYSDPYVSMDDRLSDTASKAAQAKTTASGANTAAAALALRVTALEQGGTDTSDIERRLAALERHDTPLPF